MPAAGAWHFTLQRAGGTPVYVQAVLLQQGDSLWFEFINDTERLAATPLRQQGDSLYFAMPFFESAFALQHADGQLLGTLLKGTSSGSQSWAVQAQQGVAARVPMATAPPAYNLSGSWDIRFQRPDGSWRQAVAVWQQQGSRLTGTILNPSGDYRYLEGAVWGNQLYLSAFNGSYIFAFTATIANDSTVQEGLFFSGAAPGAAFEASRNALARLPEAPPVTGMQPGSRSLSFTFPDLDSNLVSLRDARFANKVVIVQLMGSWCPNCLDETRFLSEYYRQKGNAPVEIVSLAYELSTDFGRSVRSLRKIQERIDVPYPMLVTGARSADADKAEKTLPQLTAISYFPTTIFIDKNGLVRKIHSGYYGPGAPEYFEAYKQSFEGIMHELLQE